ncbi:hypothetical protein BHS07_11295 [Myxococcus xanthus]|uniref:Uncharacterized protein n=2 Tax=Myxococcaceae TaxID=31 RepID=A0AAE6G7F4_MYXXA|nr:hypothetical protein BHS09_11390 [Myxococcus xanthus]QDE79676.1 hypothetical protein BHS08_11405 [Myxococcus xanthus]QDE87036.1 hypothetical protein BHS07_11295 [Myxococcus xanthus]QDF01205.1 hypothetical protein BHS05_11335 [Myxococcus xanthus]QDF03857.1 hypothetical protein BHS04_11685 [Myxococcus xanthus]
MGRGADKLGRREGLGVNSTGMAFQDRSNALQALEAEFQAEKASSLRKLEVKLEETLRELSEVERQLRSHRTADRRAQIARHQALRKEAEHQRWCFMVQREACGFVNHDDLDRYYPLPPSWRE